MRILSWLTGNKLIRKLVTRDFVIKLLKNFVSKEELTSILSEYPTNEEVAGELVNYVTHDELNTNNEHYDEVIEENKQELQNTITQNKQELQTNITETKQELKANITEIANELAKAKLLHVPNNGQYQAGYTYSAGALAAYNNILYLSIRNDNTGHTPGQSPDYWVEFAKTDVEVDLSDYFTKSQINSLLSNKADKSQLTNYYTKSEVDTKDSTTLTNAKTYTDQQIAKIPKPDLSNYYNKTETNNLLVNKADKSQLTNYYTKSESDERYALKSAGGAGGKYEIKKLGLRFSGGLPYESAGSNKFYSMKSISSVTVTLEDETVDEFKSHFDNNDELCLVNFYNSGGSKVLAVGVQFSNVSKTSTNSFTSYTMNLYTLDASGNSSLGLRYGFTYYWITK